MWPYALNTMPDAWYIQQQLTNSLVLAPRETWLTEVVEEILQLALAHAPHNFSAFPELLLLSRFLQAFFPLVQELLEISLFGSSPVWPPTVLGVLSAGREKLFPRLEVGLLLRLLSVHGVGFFYFWHYYTLVVYVMRRLRQRQGNADLLRGGLFG